MKKKRVALSTVVNICKKLPSEGSSSYMDAVPSLCKLLQYEDNQVYTSRGCLGSYISSVNCLTAYFENNKTL